MKLAVIVLAVILVHDDYPVWCCNGNGKTGDCKPVDCDSITETSDGYEWDKLHFTPRMVLPSFDQQCHVCVQATYYGRVPHCLFVVPSS